MIDFTNAFLYGAILEFNSRLGVYTMVYQSRTHTVPDEIAQELQQRKGVKRLNSFRWVLLRAYREPFGRLAPSKCLPVHATAPSE